MARASYTLPPRSSIFSVELHTILLGLEMVRSTGNDLSLVFSDSLSSSQAIKNKITNARNNCVKLV